MFLLGLSRYHPWSPVQPSQNIPTLSSLRSLNFPPVADTRLSEHHRPDTRPLSSVAVRLRCA